MKWTSVNQEVYAPESDIVTIDSQDITKLKAEVAHCPNKRIRICAHRKPDDLLHEMLIVISKQSYVRPHKHLEKSESFHIIEGLLDVILFDDEGNILEKISMGDPTSGKIFFYRLSAPYFHTVSVKSEVVVFHETTRGPWKKEDTIYPSWA